MKSSDHFKQTIKKYLEQRAAVDGLFAARFALPRKNIDDCATFILNSVRKSDCCGLTDEEVYSLAVHYYVEDDIDVGNPVTGCRVIVNHAVELTEEEKEQARQDAIRKVQREATDMMGKAVARRGPTSRTSTAAGAASSAAIQPDLFG